MCDSRQILGSLALTVRVCIVFFVAISAEMADGGHLALTAQGQQEAINGAIYYAPTATISYPANNDNTFLRLDDDADTGTSQGFNTTGLGPTLTPVEIGEIQATQPLPFADIPVLTIGTISYLEFGLGVVEPSNGDLVLENVEVALSGTPNPTDFTALPILYKMDHPGGIRVDSTSPGTNIDLLLYVPIQPFLDAVAADPTLTNLLLLTTFSEVTGGPERWVTNSPDDPIGGIDPPNPLPLPHSNIVPEASSLLVWLVAISISGLCFWNLRKPDGGGANRPKIGHR